MTFSQLWWWCARYEFWWWCARYEFGWEWFVRSDGLCVGRCHGDMFIEGSSGSCILGAVRLLFHRQARILIHMGWSSGVRLRGAGRLYTTSSCCAT